MNYEEAVAYIEDIPRFTTKNSLDHTRECLRRLGDPQRKFRVIHVAGTNGKGSTCAFITSVLREAGYSCGLFTSPHLVEINERFQINEEVIDDDTFLCAFEKVKKLSDELVAEGSYHPTYFETLLLMGMVIFAEAGVDYVTLETGLGGRLDATTAVEDPAACVITSISLDHMQYLGNTVSEIAGEKAGIIRPEVPVFFAQTAPESDSVIEKTAEKEGCFCKKIGKDAYEILGIEDKHIAFSCASAYYGTTTWKLNNIGTYQPGNAMLAMEVMRYLFRENGHPQEWRTALARVKWAGRMEEILPKVYVDGAHNVSAIQAFARSVPENPDGNIILFSAVKDKEYEEMISYLCKHADAEEYVVTLIDGDRATDAHILGELFRKYTEQPVTVIESVKEAMQYVLQIQGRRTVYCLGSLYLTGMIKEIIQESLSGCGEV